MHNRRKLIVAIGAGALTASMRSLAQQGTIQRVGLLWIKSKENMRRFDDMAEALRTRGYFAGRNIEFDSRFLADRYDDLSAMAKKLSLERYAVIICFGATATSAMGQATSTTSIVTVAGLDPVKAGFAESLARPRKNMTGFVTEREPMGIKRIELLKEAVPRLRHVGVVYSPQSEYQSTALEMIRSEAGKLHLKITDIEVRSPDEIRSISVRSKRSNVDGLLFGPSTLFSAFVRDLVHEVELSQIPAIFSNSEYVVAGGLLSYGPDITRRFQKGAAFVERVLKGEKPGDIPIEQETKYDLVLNLKAAKALGITIANSVLARADQVIQ